MAQIQEFIGNVYHHSQGFQISGINVINKFKTLAQ